MPKRLRLLDVPSGLLERLECRGAGGAPGAEDFSPHFQVAFPLRGMFAWHVCGDVVVSDPTQVLYIRGGEPFRVSEPRPGGYVEAIVTPSYGLLADLTEATGFSPDRHPLFRFRSRRATPALQRTCARLLHRTAPAADLFAAEEDLVGLLRAALTVEPPGRWPSTSTRRLIGRAKEYLDAHFAERLSLADVARAVGASPAYLTDVFRRFEGVSLQRYVTQLRLARALMELPHTEDLTALALDLGYSSHSHFTLVFRRGFGCTPSEFRRLTRPQQRIQLASIAFSRPAQRSASVA